MSAAETHAIDEREIVLHEISHRCCCRPAWVAQWSDELESVVWVFVHRLLGGAVA